MKTNRRVGAPWNARARSRRLRSLVCLFAFLLHVGSVGGLPGIAFADDFGGQADAGNPEDDEPDDCGECDSGTSCCDDCPCSSSPGGAPGGGSSGGSTGKPIFVATGKELLSTVDLEVPGVYPIALTRSYDSQSRYDSPLGHGWAFSYDMQLYEYPDGSVIVRSGVGSRNRYVPAGGGFAAEEPDRTSALAENADGSFTLRYARGEKAHFDVEGRLTALESPQGNRLEMSYEAGGPHPLIGTSRYSVDPDRPILTGLHPRLSRVAERLADGTLTGRHVDFAYDSVTGRLVLATSSDGRSVQYVHDTVDVEGTLLTRGNLEQVIGLEGIVETYGYADPLDPHNVTSIQQGPGQTPHINVYDDQDRVVLQSHGDSVLTFDYGTPLRTAVTRTIVDETGGNPQQAVTVWEYTPSGRITRRIDALGNEFRNIRDASERIQRMEVYHNQGTSAAPQLVLEKAIDFEYDPVSGLMSSRTTALASGETVSQRWEYDHGWTSAYETVSSADASKLFRTEYTFYRTGGGAADEPTNVREVKRRRADGSFETTLLTYDANGQLETATPPPVDPADGLVVRRSYYGASDPHPGRLQEIALEIGGAPDGHLRRSFTYDARGYVDTVTDARGNPTDFDFDGRGRLTQVENALGEQTLFSYSGPNSGLDYGSTPAPAGPWLESVEVGRTLADGEGQVRRLRWDGRGRLLEVERKGDAGAFTSFAQYSYDSDGERLSATDGEGRVTRFAYDLLRRLRSVTDAAVVPNVTQFAYDATGDRIRVTDAKLRDTVFVYDAMDRLVEVQQQATSPDLITKFAYDAAGNVTSVTDPKNQETLYEYDALSRLASVTQPLGQQVQYRYDGRSRLSRVVNARGHALDYRYLPWGGLDAVEHFESEAIADSGTPPERTVGYAYDLAGNLTGTSDTDLSLASPDLYSFSYDELNRVDVVTALYLPQGPVTLDSDYDRYGNRSDLTVDDGGPVLEHAWTFDKLDRLVQADLPGSAQPLQFEYYGNDDLRKMTHGNGATTDYLYFPEGPVQRITVKESGGTQLLDLEYQVDKVLNVDSIVERHGPGEGPYVYDYGYDEVDRLTSAQYPTELGLPPSESFAYDAAGNRQSPIDPALFDYDANNRIVESGDRTYLFDDDGNVEQIVSAMKTEQFTFDRENRLREWSDGTSSATYAYDPFGRRIRKTVDGLTTWFLWDDEALLLEYESVGQRRVRYAYAGDIAPHQFSESASGVVYDVHFDHLGTPRRLSSADGSVAWDARYDAFGGVDALGLDLAFRAAFPGQYVDEETGLYYNQQRYYDPALGRYMSGDPIGQLGGLNVFEYARNSPLNYMDPDGRVVIAAAASVALVAAAAAALLTAAALAGVAIGKGLLAVQAAAQDTCPPPADTPDAPAEDAPASPDTSNPSPRFDPDQQAAVELAKQAAKTGLSAEAAEALVELANEVGVPARGPETHPGRPHGKEPHIHVGPINHIPVR